MLASQSLDGAETFVSLYNGVFATPLNALEKASQTLEALMVEGHKSIPQGRRSPLFMFMDPFMGGGGFHGLPGGFGGGFHGNPMMHGHHPMMHGHYPMMHGHHPMMHGHPIGLPRHPMMHSHPGGFFYDLVGPPNMAIHEDRQNSENQVVDEWMFLCVVLFCVLVVAPVSEELVFRHLSANARYVWERVEMICDRKTCGANGETANNRPAEQSARKPASLTHRRWILVSSFVFAAAHLNNHIPSSDGSDALLRELGVDGAEKQITMALTQFFVTLFSSIRVFVPVCEDMGLAASMGAHFMWNACAMQLAPNFWIRVGFLGLAFWQQGRRPASSIEGDADMRRKRCLALGGSAEAESIHKLK